MKKKSIRIMSMVLAFALISAYVFTFGETVCISAEKSIFMLGNDPNSIVNGGILLESGGLSFSATGNGIYSDIFSENPVKIASTANARNLNLFDDTLFYSAYDSAHDETSIYKITRLSTNPKKSLVCKESGTILQMYHISILSSQYLTYLKNGTIVKYRYDRDKRTTYCPNLEITGFVPLAEGDIYYQKSESDYTLYVTRNDTAVYLRPPRENGSFLSVNSFYIDNYNDAKAGRLYVYCNNDGEYSALLTNLFTEHTLLEKTEEPEIQYSNVTDPTGDEILSDEEYEVSASKENAVYADDVMYRGIEAFTTGAQRSIIKNARQIREIEWTCKKDVKISSSYTLSAGVTYHGIPYDQHGGYYVGYEDSEGDLITLDRFISATDDETSTFYNRNNYYCADCSSFISYALGLEKKQTTRGLANKDGNLISNCLGSFSSDEGGIDTLFKLQIGDYLDVPKDTENDKDGHCILIASIQYNEYGDIIQIITMEQTRPVTGTKRNFQVYDISVGLDTTDNTTKNYNQKARDGEALPLSALLLKMRTAGYMPYSAYRVFQRGSISYTPCDQVVLELDTPELKVESSTHGFGVLVCPPVENADYYSIYCSPTENGDYYLIATISSTSGFSYEARYKTAYYKVKASKDYNAGADDAAAVVESESKIVMVDNSGKSPQSITAVVENNKIAIRWNAPQSASSSLKYGVYFSNSPFEGYELYTVTDKSYAFIYDLLPDTAYYLKVCVMEGDKAGVPIYFAIHSSGRILGDVNEDGIINTGDTITVLRSITGFASENDTASEFCGDVDYNGAVNTGDAIAILRYCAGLDSLPSYTIADVINSR